MNVVQLRNTVKRVVVVAEDGPVTVFEKKEKSKISKRNKRAEARTRSLVKANMTALQTYMDAHHKSNRKKKDGWMRDYRWNLGKAVRKGVKKIKLLG